ncbi:MAG: ABC transporter permease [Synergistaceae bacterium]|jgi:peptide/nickel transport system permease protein|nr:ABC transporter permease [Synergistaceae bacterium]
MKYSAICLTFLVILAIAIPLDPQDGRVAPNYSKPAWLDRSVASTVVLRVGDETPTASLTWNYAPPQGFLLTGRLDQGSLLWTTPEREFALASKPEDLSLNHVSLRTRLKLNPLENLLSIFFPTHGECRLSLVGQGDVTMTVESGLWGWLGTDHLGRDVAVLFVQGVRVSLLVGVAATLIATLLGLSLGLLSGYAGGLTDTLIMRAVDVLLSIPTLPILMVLAKLWGKGLWNLVVILSIFSWMGTARTVRSMTLSLRNAPWVEGLRALGARRNYILFRHLTLEAMPLLLANVALNVPGMILAEAGLAFLGLSDPNVLSWGRMLHEAHEFGAFTSGAWWTILPPGVGISVICLIFMNLGRRLEERADPRLKQGAGPLGL